MPNVLRFLFLMAVALCITGLMQGREFPLFSSNYLFPEELQGKWKLSEVLCDGKLAGFTELIQEGMVEVEWAVTGTSTRAEEKIGTCRKTTNFEKPYLFSSSIVQVLIGKVECNSECQSVSKEACGAKPQTERLTYFFEGSHMKVRRELPSRYCGNIQQVATYIFERVL